MPRPAATLVATASLLLAAAVAPDARANGRFPAAQYVLVGPGAESSTIVLRTTFGLMVSRDGGGSFHWICEEALLYSGQWDPAPALSADGALHVGLVDGLARSRDGCAFERSASAGGMLMADLSNSPDGETLWAIEGAAGVPNHVLVSADRGASFRILGAGASGVQPLTVDAAPSDPTRVYATATTEGTQAPVVLRSVDGGVTLRVLATDLMGASDAFLAAIDPMDPDRVWVRANRGANTLLLRSDDAGDTMHLAAMTAGPMLGFAISDDAQRIWIGGETDGVLRSDDGGVTFRPVSNLHVTCMRYHAGALYLCADWLREDYALYRWRDGAAAPEGLLRLHQAAGPLDCPAGSPEHDVCGARWPMQQALVTPRTRDAGTDGGAVADGATLDAAGSMDASSADAGTPPRPGACSCSTSARLPHVGARFALLLAAGVALRSRRRRAGARASFTARGEPLDDHPCG